jgi:hypothetical protein
MKANEVVIIKPDTPAGKVAAEAREKLMQNSGYDTKTILYDPKNPAYQKGSGTYIGGGNKDFLDLTKKSRQ